MNSSNKYAFRLLLAVFFGLALSACGESKIAQCNKLIVVANKSQSIAVSTDVTALPGLADSIDEIKAEIQTIELSDRKLQEIQTQLVDMYAQASQSIRDIERAQTNSDREAFELASNTAREAIAKEEPLVNEINQYCSN